MTFKGPQTIQRNFEMKFKEFSCFIWSEVTFFSAVFRFFSIKMISFGSNINDVFECNNDQLNTDDKIV